MQFKESHLDLGRILYVLKRTVLQCFMFLLVVLVVILAAHHFGFVEIKPKTYTLTIFPILTAVLCLMRLPNVGNSDLLLREYIRKVAKATKVSKLGFLVKSATH